MKLIRALLNSLKWWVAEEEMKTLFRYRWALNQAQNQLAQFPDAVQALDYVKVMAECDPLEQSIHIQDLRKRMEGQREDFLRAMHTFRTRA